MELVAKLQNVDELHVVLPLFLSGGAFAVYLSDEIKEDYKEVKNALTTAFSASPATAYEEFINRRLKENESVDVYLAELTRLSKLISSHVSEEWIRCALGRSVFRGRKNYNFATLFSHSTLVYKTFSEKNFEKFQIS